MLTTAAMNNGMNIPPPIQLHQHPLASPQAADLYGYNLPPQSIMYQPSSTSVGSVASFASTTSSTSSNGNHKRGRLGREVSSTSVLSYHNYYPQQQMQQQQHLPAHDSNMNPPMVQVVQYPSVTNQDDDDNSESYGSSVTPKKARPSNYQPPRYVRPNLLTVMGTLASPNRGTTVTTTTSSPFHLNHHCSTTPAPTHVPIRRQLSGGNLEEYLGNHHNNNAMPMDRMDTFVDRNRPRSMSF